MKKYQTPLSLKAFSLFIHIGRFHLKVRGLSKPFYTTDRSGRKEIDQWLVMG